jgi:hypothetical protein
LEEAFLIRNKDAIEPGFEQFAGRYYEDCGNQFSKLASASRRWQVGELAAALPIKGFIPRGSAKAGGGLETGMLLSRDLNHSREGTAMIAGIISAS